MSTMRPIDELPDTATVSVRRNASMAWLTDEHGVSYVAPKWLWGVIECSWQGGYRECQADMREVLGIRDLIGTIEVPPDGECCQGASGKVEVKDGG